MTPLELQPTSTEVQKLLAFATKWKSKTAQNLAQVVREKFETVLDVVEKDGEIGMMVLDFILKKEKFTSHETQKFRKMVLQALEKPHQHQKATWEDMDLEMGDGEDFGTPELAKLALSIRLLYSSTWYSREKVDDFSSVSQDYLDAFLEFYGEGEDLSDKNWTVKTKEKKSKKNKKEEKWKEDDEDPYNGFLKAGDMVIVKTIITMLQSYLDALLRKMWGESATSEATKNILQKEIENGRWNKLAKILTRIKKIPFQHNIMDNLEEFDYSFDDAMSTLLECWDSYGIQIQDMLDENK